MVLFDRPLSYISIKKGMIDMNRTLKRIARDIFRGVLREFVRDMYRR